MAKKISPITVVGWIIIVISLVAFTVNDLITIPRIEEWYKGYQTILSDAQQYIANLSNKWIILLVIFALFIIKSMSPVPLFPVSFICVLTSLVFTPAISLIIEIIGFILLFSSKYFLGRKRGGGVAEKFLTNYSKVWEKLEYRGEGNPWLLLVFRAIPVVPINSVSSIYGSFKTNYFKYLIISLAGFSPRLLTYTMIGQNVFDPLSSAFITPIASLLMLTGLSMVGGQSLISYIFNSKNADRDISENAENIN